MIDFRNMRSAIGLLVLLGLLALTSCNKEEETACAEGQISIGSACMYVDLDSCSTIWRGYIDYFCLRDSLAYVYTCNSYGRMIVGGTADGPNGSAGVGGIQAGDQIFCQLACRMDREDHLYRNTEATTLVMPLLEDIQSRDVIEAKLYQMEWPHPDAAILDSTTVTMVRSRR